jgi:cell division protein FtsN
MKRLKQLNVVMNLLQCENGGVLPVLLLTVLLLAASGAYLFYFTDLVIKHDQGNEILTSNSSLVKKPMPPHREIPGAVRKEKTTIALQQTAADLKRKTGADRPSPVKISVQKKVSPAKNTKKQIAVKTRPDDKLEKLTTDKQIAKAGPAAKPSVASVTVPEKGKYTLLIGVYVMKKSMIPEKTKLMSAGLKPEISKGPKKMEPMNRLFIGRFDSYAGAALEKKKLAKATKDAFILPEKGKFAVYAGSYFENKRAISEHEKLAKTGLKSEIVQTRVPISTFRLTAGSFATKELAAKEAQRLKKLGLAALVTGSGI